MKIKKGDIVGRISYDKDILFYVDRIIKISSLNKEIAILKGVNYRIEADSPLEDLEKIEKDEIENEKRGIENKIKEKLNVIGKNMHLREGSSNSNSKISNAVILHIDGDRKYTQKSEKYYNKLGLNAVVKNIPESRQPLFIGELVRKYDPDILVITRTWWDD